MTEHRICTLFSIGAAYVGGPKIVLITDRCPGMQVMVVYLN